MSIRSAQFTWKGMTTFERRRGVDAIRLTRGHGDSISGKE